MTVSLSPRYLCTDNLNNALGAIRVLGLELIEDELRPHLNTVLINIRERSESTSALTVLCDNWSPLGIWQQFAALRPPTLNRSQCITALVLTVLASHPSTTTGATSVGFLSKGVCLQLRRGNDGTCGEKQSSER